MNIPCQMSFVSNWQHIFIDKIKDRGEGDFYDSTIKTTNFFARKKLFLQKNLII